MKRALVGLFVVACAHRAEVQPTIVIKPYVACSEAKTPADRAACIVHRKMEDARKSRDVVKLLCEKDKADKIAELREAREEAPDDVQRSIIDAKVRQLAREAEQCLGELLARTP